MSDASITPSAYLIPRTDVPVTIGRRVRSMVLAEMEEEVEEFARAEPPAERDSDMVVMISRSLITDCFLKRKAREEILKIETMEGKLDCCDFEE